LKTLFIGNSYTFYNDMPKIFEKLAIDNDKDVQTIAVTKGGHKLIEYAEANDEYTKNVYDAVEGNRYDYCILQDYSTITITSPDLFEKGVKEVYDMVKGSVDKVILYQTWGSHSNHKFILENNLTTKSMFEIIKKAYDKIGKELGFKVSPVGKNFLEVFENSDIELYHEDCKHPSYKGSCLSALTHYYTIFGEFPKNTASLNLTQEKIDIFKNTVAK